jgi:hypothetical protein
VKETQYEGASERNVSFSWSPGKIMGGEDYLLQMTIPNTFFHVAMAYAILRHNGVDVGKMDFLGPISAPGGGGSNSSAPGAQSEAAVRSALRFHGGAGPRSRRRGGVRLKAMLS